MAHLTREDLLRELLARQRWAIGYLMTVLGGDVHAAEEVYQETAVALLQQEVPESVTDAGAWLGGIIRNQALMHLRSATRARRRGQPMDPELLAALAGCSEGESADGRDEEAALARCLDELPDPARRMIERRYAAGEDFATIATALASTEAAVQRAISRLRQRLRDCIEQRLAGQA
ncbi:MAG TPA: hypothetical protein DCS97_08575 [Planctomycetes bacterium]|nr:hypothetical protein [Planctomycetota bacterium]